MVYPRLTASIAVDLAGMKKLSFLWYNASSLALRADGAGYRDVGDVYARHAAGRYGAAFV